MTNTKECDALIGLGNYGFRYYDPETGCYISQDPIFEQLMKNVKKEGCKGDAVYERIIKGSQRSDKAYDKAVKVLTK